MTKPSQPCVTGVCCKTHQRWPGTSPISKTTNNTKNKTNYQI